MNVELGVERIYASESADAGRGRIAWSPAKSIWIGGMTLSAILLAPIYFSWSAFAVFLVTCAVTLCFGHSVGMHRRLIHKSFDCPRWLEYVCVYLGTLVGMAGPLGMVKLHDFRDWAQRQPDCHDYFCHRKNFWHDAWWQLHCELVLSNPPDFLPEPKLRDDRFYEFIERTWMLQQLPWALLLLFVGGVAWVVWGIFARIAICVTGHWLVGHFAHREGDQSWIVEGAGVQGYNVRIAGLISMGEGWHNNHHAFPGSAKLGLQPGEVDPGWWLIKAFERLGLATNIVTPEIMPYRATLKTLHPNSADPCHTHVFMLR
ncbi:MAG TPA: acyl-CoA desaturase [Rhizomicrobium sp.]|jgi:stearoyl-CoA desaturase (delta-9 desaturase)